MISFDGLGARVGGTELGRVYNWQLHRPFESTVQLVQNSVKTHTQRYKMSDFKDFKVADFNLWEWGRKEIIIGKKLYEF